MLSNIFKYQLTLSSARCFATNASTRLYVDRYDIRYPKDFAQDILAGPQRLRVLRQKMPVRVDK